MARRKIYKVSKAEKEIKYLLEKNGYEVVPQFRISGVPFIYDFYLPKLNLIIEYQGDYWHANPDKFKARTLIKMAGFKEKIFVDYIWRRDELKARMAEDCGYEVRYVWESDYKRKGWLAIKAVL